MKLFSKEEVVVRPKKIFCFYDSKAESFGEQPMFFETTGLAIRAIEKSVNTPGSGFCEHPEDYTFFEIGSYDATSGVIQMYESKKSLGLALDFKKTSSSTVN